MEKLKTVLDDARQVLHAIGRNYRMLSVQVVMFGVSFVLCSYSPVYNNSYNNSYTGIEYGGGMHVNDMTTPGMYTPMTYSIYVSHNNYNMLGVIAYDENGDYYEDNIRDHESGVWGSSDFWDNDYMYEYYLDDEGSWWRCNNGRWQKWINVLGWHWSEVIYQSEPSVPYHEMFKEKQTSLDASNALLAILSIVAVVMFIIRCGWLAKHNSQ